MSEQEREERANGNHLEKGPGVKQSPRGCGRLAWVVLVAAVILILASAAFVVGWVIREKEVERLQAEVLSLKAAIENDKKVAANAQRAHEGKKLCFDIAKQESKYTNYVGWEYAEPDEGHLNGRCFVTFKQTGKRAECVEPVRPEPIAKGGTSWQWSLYWEARTEFSLCKNGQFRNEY